jgi:hypothetical protein
VRLLIHCPAEHDRVEESWDKVYSHELENYEDIGEEGEIWSESSSYIYLNMIR